MTNDIILFYDIPPFMIVGDSFSIPIIVTNNLNSPIKKLQIDIGFVSPNLVADISVGLVTAQPGSNDAKTLKLSATDVGDKSIL